MLSLPHTLFLFHDPRVLFQQQSITYSSSSSLTRLQSEHCALACPPLYLSPSLSPSPPHPQRTPYFLVSLHRRSAFPYLRFPLWLADNYPFGGPPQATAFSFPGRNGFSAYLHRQWSYRTSHAYSFDSYLLHKEEGSCWERGSLVTFKGWCFRVLSSPQKCACYSGFGCERSQNYSLLSKIKKKGEMWKHVGVSLPDNHGLCVGMHMCLYINTSRKSLHTKHLLHLTCIELEKNNIVVISELVGKFRDYLLIHPLLPRSRPI